MEQPELFVKILTEMRALLINSLSLELKKQILQLKCKNEAYVTSLAKSALEQSRNPAHTTQQHRTNTDQTLQLHEFLLDSFSSTGLQGHSPKMG